MVEGLEKVVAMLEERFGRTATTGLLLLIGFAIAAYSLHIIVIHLVVPFYAFVSSHLSGVLEINIVTVFYVTAFIAAGVLLLPLVWLVITKRKVSQNVLDQLAELRSKAIREILNAKITTDDELRAWKTINEQWRADVINVLKDHFPKAEVLGFERLGVIQQLAFLSTYNGEHQHERDMFVKRLSIVEDIIRRHSRS